MTTVYSAARDIAYSCVETLTFQLANDQVSPVFDLTELIIEESSNFLGCLFSTADIVSLWRDMGYPEPEQMGDSIMESINGAILCEILTGAEISETVNLSVNTWAADILYERKTDLDTFDLGDTQELVRALA